MISRNTIKRIFTVAASGLMAAVTATVIAAAATPPAPIAEQPVLLPAVQGGNPDRGIEAFIIAEYNGSLGSR